MNTKYLRIIILSILLMQVPNMTYAAPVGNIAEPKALRSLFITKDKARPPIGITIGEETDFSFDRKVEDHGFHGDSEYDFVGGKVGVIFFDLFTIYGIVGRALCKEYYSDEGMTAEADSEPATAWAVGGKAILYEFPVKMEQVKDCVVRFGVDGRYRSADFDINRVAINGQWYYLPDTGVANVKLKIEDWQAAGEVSVQVGPFIPYCGIKYSDFRSDTHVKVFDVTYDDDSVEPESRWGFFVGADIVMFKSVSLNIEGRFFDETALSLGCTMRL
ncbi:MAG: hypothetical protein PHV48_08025 [Candidatus Omnitrophica bacterium]|nr:hypothetical protein [Candidatus Omnitrophota bacterium]